MKDNSWMEDLVVIPNKIFEISETKAKTLRQESKDEINIPTGLFTQKEIEDAKLLFQADEVFVQSDALPSDTKKLEKAYQNVAEQLDKEFNFTANDKIAGNYKAWAVISAVAAFETAEARDTVETLHKRSTKNMGFKAIYINNQIMFD